MTAQADSATGNPSTASGPPRPQGEAAARAQARHTTYLGMHLLLPHESVSGHAEFGYASVPHILDQGPDLICFWDIV